MPDALARDWGFEMRRVLTGFKYIGDHFLMGFEESYGYLVGTHARDKDAIVATMLCVEMASYYAEKGMDLYEAMDALYQKYGYYLNGTVNASFPGAAGAEKMAGIMDGLRTNPPAEIAGYKVTGVTSSSSASRTTTRSSSARPAPSPRSRRTSSPRAPRVRSPRPCALSSRPRPRRFCRRVVTYARSRGGPADQRRRGLLPLTEPRSTSSSRQSWPLACVAEMRVVAL